MPDKYGFNILGNDVKCIEPQCENGGKMWEWPEERRKVHFLSHNFVMAGNTPAITGAKRTDNCRVCGRQFEQEKRRGRPRVKCYVCKPE